MEGDLEKGAIFRGSDFNYHLQGMAEASRYPGLAFGEMRGLIDRIGLWNEVQSAGRVSATDLRQLVPAIAWAQIGVISFRSLHEAGRTGTYRSVSGQGGGR